MKRFMVLLILLLVGCQTYRYPTNLRSQCQLALDRAEIELNVRSQAPWKVKVIPSQRTINGGWCFLTPDDTYSSYWTSKDGRVSYIVSDPVNKNSISYEDLLNVAKQHLVNSNK